MTVISPKHVTFLSLMVTTKLVAFVSHTINITIIIFQYAAGFVSATSSRSKLNEVSSISSLQCCHFFKTERRQGVSTFRDILLFRCNRGLISFVTKAAVIRTRYLATSYLGSAFHDPVFSMIHILVLWVCETRALSRFKKVVLVIDGHCALFCMEKRSIVAKFRRFVDVTMYAGLERDLQEDH